MKNVISFLLVAAFIAAATLGIWWVIWSLWCWVLPAIWAGGPQNVISPNYWLFAGAWTLLSLIGRAIFGGRSKD